MYHPSAAALWTSTGGLVTVNPVLSTPEIGMKEKKVYFQNDSDVELFVHARALGGTFFVRVYDYPAENCRPLAPKGKLTFPVDSRLAACFNGTAIRIDFSVHTKVKGNKHPLACILSRQPDGRLLLFVPA